MRIQRMRIQSSPASSRFSHSQVLASRFQLCRSAARGLRPSIPFHSHFSLSVFCRSVFGFQFSVFAPGSRHILTSSPASRHWRRRRQPSHNHRSWRGAPHVPLPVVSMYLRICGDAGCSANGATLPLQPPCVKVNSKYYFLDTLPSPSRRPELS